MMDEALGVAVNWTPPPQPPKTPMVGRYCRMEPLLALSESELARVASDLHHASDESQWTYLSYGPFESLFEYRAWLDMTCLSDDPLFFAIVDLRTGQAAGLASYLRIAPKHGSIEVGHINLTPSLQRSRAATEAMYLMMKRAFALGYRRYEWKCHALNQKSRSSAQRLGFSYEGVFRQATVSKGRNRDTAWYAAIDGEWPALQAAFEVWLNPENFDEVGKQRRSLSELTAPVLFVPSPQ